MSQFLPIAELETFYSAFSRKISDIKNTLQKPLTLTEKILLSHLYGETDLDAIERGKTELQLAPDRVAMQDATAQMAILQFITVGVDKVATPTSVHMDHLIRAVKGADDDLENAKNENSEVYNFLNSASKKYGMDCWNPGSGIIHQIVLENYAFPGGLIIGTDSHTPTAGGLGMIAIGVGGADAVDVMTKQPWQLKMPKIIGVHLKGKLNNWTSPKDLILYICGLLTAKGATGKVLEYFGEGISSISCTGKATITNMGAEVGATTSLFPYDSKMYAYLKATGREDIATLADQYAADLQPDVEVAQNPKEYYDEIIEIDLSTLEPALNGPHSPDVYHTVSKMKEEHAALDIPENIDYCLIGSCTNSSYEDISKAASIVKDALEKGIQLKTPLLVSPGSNLIAETMKQDGFTEIFEKAGATILSNSCGPCIGQWNRKDKDDLDPDKKSVLVSSFNRNFRKRNDGREQTYAFVASPELVVALAYGGKLTFNPITDSLENGAMLKVPEGQDLPVNGFAETDLNFEPPAEDGGSLEVNVNPESERIQLLEPFQAWNIPSDFENLRILVKAKGKCTTDHISPAGPWLKYRGHLDSISGNMFSGAVNAYRDEVGKGKNVNSGEIDEYNQVARSYKKEGIGWVAVGDENYGEGSSREHAAMEPRYLGCCAIIAKSFARIAETNLKKQGILPLCFKTPDDYDKLLEHDELTILDLENLEPSNIIRVQIKHADGSEEEIETSHTMSEEQVDWFYEGSALNKAGKALRG